MEEAFADLPTAAATADYPLLALDVGVLGLGGELTHAVAVPILKREGGVLLALPEGAALDAVPEGGVVGPCSLVRGRVRQRARNLGPIRGYVAVWIVDLSADAAAYLEVVREPEVVEAIHSYIHFGFSRGRLRLPAAADLVEVARE